MGLGPECKSETIIKLLEENIGISLSNFGFGNGFLDMISKARITTEKIDKLDFIKILFKKGHYQESDKRWRWR